ncbi:inclusion body family protein [Mucilaginibacter ginsenosidivorax]|uniref:Inclusion body protein n=1 Tax=Mucilaginibacter ginsenosidivorax TaxID=862126 RepID=A0A5B8W466_9SPHI|nr:inclusion body family protein [Mucilaginibacter ginsenosidivorax]QEC78329.1 hypothetical protein FSB76_21160 [Mucilaginibacter ginsenosidivorax]
MAISPASDSNEIVYIQIVIDTEAIIADNPTPSTNADSPTGLAHNYMYMVATRGNVFTPQSEGTADLNVKAITGDVIRWYAVSENGNFDTAVAIYKIARYDGSDDVFSTVDFNVFNRTGILPTDRTTFPITFSLQSYWFNSATILKTGTENYSISFALYRHTRDQAEPVLFGYFWWDPTLTIQF